jgi:casein kinase II subunit alpha
MGVISINNIRQSDKFEVIRSLGRGKYSEVFKGIDTGSGKYCAVKVLKPGNFSPLIEVRKSKIMREIKILEALRGGPNVIQLHDCCYDQMSKTICLIFEFICEKNFKELLQN